MNPILSIVIPTKNRYEYLKILLESLLAKKNHEFEIVIQDNSDDNAEFEKYINSYNDSRLKYNHTEGWLSVIDNCDLAVGAASGEYVCMLGDDDGVLIDQSLEVVKFLKEQNIGGANVNKISYGWPDTSHGVWGDAYSGVVNFKAFTNRATKFDMSKELEKLLKNGAAFGLGNLARTYHGFVSLEKLKEIKKETGSFFPGPSPDMANAIGLSKYIDNYLFISIPTVISGHCKKSTGGQGGMKQHHGKIESIGHLPKDTAEKWSKDIPFFWSGPTIYSESARRALQATNRSTDDLNYSALYACCFVYEKYFKRKVFKAMYNRKGLFAKILISIKVVLRIVGIFFRRVYYFAKNMYNNKMKSAEKVVKANDIHEVIEYFEQNYPIVKFNSIELRG